MKAIHQSNAIRMGCLLSVLVFGLPTLAGGKKAKPASGVNTVKRRGVILFGTTFWQVDFKPNCDLAYLKHGPGNESEFHSQQEFITLNLDALCKPDVKLNQGSYTGKPAEVFRLEVNGRCEPRSIRRLDGTPEDLKAFEIRFNQKCELLAFSRNPAKTALPG